MSRPTDAEHADPSGWSAQLARVTPAALLHVRARNQGPYRRLLDHVAGLPDVWRVSQGGLLDWWQRRARARLHLVVDGGRCRVSTDLPHAVVQTSADELEIAPASTAVGSATVEGSVRLHLPQGLPHAEALAEILSREGIPYFRFAAPDGKSPHLGPAELTPLIERIVTVLEWPRPDRLQPLVDELLALVGRAMAGVGLPLFRLWYFPADGRTIRRSAFSPRFDVDRAIQLVPRIYDMERATGAESTYYLRAFGPYYDERAIADLARSCNGIDLALHGEFATNAPRFGGVTPAAREEKGLLESMIGRPIRGVSMHGGDLAYNSGPESQAAVAAAGFGYDTTSGPWPPALPIRTVVGGKLQPVHVLAHSLIDVHTIPFHWQRIADGDRVLRVIRWRDIGRQLVSSSFWRYESRLLAQALAGLEQARASNTVFVPAFHPVYFGAASYLARLPSWGPNLVRHRRVARSGTEHDGNR